MWEVMWSRLTVVVLHEFHPQVRFRLFVLFRPTCFSQMCSKRASAEVHLSEHLSHWQDRLSSAAMAGRGASDAVVLAGAASGWVSWADMTNERPLLIGCWERGRRYNGVLRLLMQSISVILCLYRYRIVSSEGAK